MLAVVLSLAAAFAFSFAAMLISRLQGKVGPFQLGRWQMAMAFAMTAAVSLALGGWHGVTGSQFAYLAASSAAGIMLASTTYFAAIHAAGPRITAVLFSLAAPFGLILGYLFLGEVVNAMQGAGIALILTGILLAVLVADPGDRPTKPLWHGILLGVITSLGQAAGTLLARPAMATGVEAFTAMAIRSGLGALFFIALMILPFARAARMPDAHSLWTIGGSAFAGIFLGMSLMMAALSSGQVGIVATLTSTTPVLILPLIWITTGRAPALAGWIGAGLAVLGTGLISLGM